jgi:hypothetical protein
LLSQDLGGTLNSCQPPKLERSHLFATSISSEPGLRGELPAASAEVTLVDKCR